MKRRLLVINSNTSPHITELVERQARRVARTGTQILPETGAFGGRLIGSRTELAIAAHATMAIAMPYVGKCEGVLLAVSLEPGLMALKERMRVPAIGMTEAALLVASAIGGKIGYLTFPRRALPLVRELVVAHGFEGRLGALEAIDADMSAYSDPAKVVDKLRQGALAMVENSQVESIILGGAATAGLASSVQKGVPVPVIDCISAGVTMLEAMIDMNLSVATVGTFHPIKLSSDVALRPVKERAARSRKGRR